MSQSPQQQGASTIDQDLVCTALYPSKEFSSFMCCYNVSVIFLLTILDDHSTKFVERETHRAGFLKIHISDHQTDR